MFVYIFPVAYLPIAMVTDNAVEYGEKNEDSRDVSFTLSCFDRPETAGDEEDAKGEKQVVGGDGNPDVLLLFARLNTPASGGSMISSPYPITPNIDGPVPLRMMSSPSCPLLTL